MIFSFYAHNFITLRARTAQCIVIGPVCGFVTAGGRCPNLTTASARSVCVSLGAFFIFLLHPGCDQLWFLFFYDLRVCRSQLKLILSYLSVQRTHQLGVSKRGALPLKRFTTTFPLEASRVGRLGALRREQQWAHALSFACTNTNANEYDDIFSWPTVWILYSIWSQIINTFSA